MEKNLQTPPFENAAVPLDDLCKNAVELIRYSRSIALKQVDLIQLTTYFILGKWIVDVQQEGAARAKYGKNVLDTLSDWLNKAFGKGFSVSTLTNIRKFYLTYQERIPEPVVREFATKKSQPPVTILEKEPPFRLSWTHYLILMRIARQRRTEFLRTAGVAGRLGKKRTKPSVWQLTVRTSFGGKR